MSHSMAKPIKWSVLPAKTQISLDILPVWSESSLSAWKNLGSLATNKVHSEDSDQTGQMPRLIWVFAGGTDQFVSFVVLRLIQDKSSSINSYALIKTVELTLSDSFSLMVQQAISHGYIVAISESQCWSPSTKVQKQYLHVYLHLNNVRHLRQNEPSHDLSS